MKNQTPVLNTLITLIGLVSIIVCFMVNDSEVYAGGVSIGTDLNFFGLVVGGICTLLSFGCMSDEKKYGIRKGTLWATHKLAILILVIHTLNFVLIKTGNTVTMSRNDTSIVSGMGMSVRVRPILGAYIPIGLAVVNVVLAFLRKGQLNRLPSESASTN